MLTVTTAAILSRCWRMIPGEALAWIVSPLSPVSRSSMSSALVGAHRFATHPVVEEVELSFLDPVFGIASCAMELPVEPLRLPQRMIRGKVRHEEARVLSVGIDLSLGDDLAGTAPTWR